MTILDSRHFGMFAGDHIARERATPATPVIQQWVRGTAFCQGCNARKPIAGTSFKGWRCHDCKKSRKPSKNR